MALYPFKDCLKYLKYFICLINSYVIFHYKRHFLSSNSAFQINDARQLPIIIPSPEQLDIFKAIFDTAIDTKKKIYVGIINETKGNQSLQKIQEKLDDLVSKLYSV